MQKITVSLPDGFVARLQRLASDNHRPLHREVTLLLAESVSQPNRARRAKIAVLAATKADAKLFALAHGYRRDQWFYAHSIESATGRYVRRIEATGNYKPRKNHDKLMVELRGGELAAAAHAQ